jgi:hypothetical protein
VAYAAICEIDRRFEKLDLILDRRDNKHRMLFAVYQTSTARFNRRMSRLDCLMGRWDIVADNDVNVVGVLCHGSSL